MRTFAGSMLALLMLAGCGEKPQEQAGRTVRGGAQAWEGPKTAFTAPGWTVGDRASWAAHLQTRAQTMNEYMRIDIGK